MASNPQPRGGMQHIRIKKKGQMLKTAGFGACVHPDGCACAGAGKIVEGKLRCGNQNRSVTAEQAKDCTRKTQHTFSH